MKLYPEEESGPLSTKKPVVVESYDEVVISEPSEAFFSRVQNHPAVIVPRLPLDFNLPPGAFCFRALLVIECWLLIVLPDVMFLCFPTCLTVPQDISMCSFLQCLPKILTTITEVTPKIIP